METKVNAAFGTVPLSPLPARMLAGHSGPPWFLPGAAPSDRSQPRPHPTLRQRWGSSLPSQLFPLCGFSLKAAIESRAQAWWNRDRGLQL